MTTETLAGETLTRDIRVRFMGDLPAITGTRDLHLTVPGESTVGGLFETLSELYGEAFTSRVFAGPAELQHTVLVFVDGEDIKEQDGFATRLGDGGVEVIMLPMFGGG